MCCCQNCSTEIVAKGTGHSKITTGSLDSSIKGDIEAIDKGKNQTEEIPALTLLLSPDTLEVAGAKRISTGLETVTIIVSPSWRSI